LLFETEIYFLNGATISIKIIQEFNESKA